MSALRRARSEDDVAVLVVSRREGGFGGAVRARVTGMTRRGLSIYLSVVANGIKSNRIESTPSMLEITT